MASVEGGGEGIEKGGNNSAGVVDAIQGDGTDGITLWEIELCGEGSNV